MTTASPDDIARLYGRAAFGASKTQLTDNAGKDYAAVVEALFPTATSLPALADEPRRIQLESGTTDYNAAIRWWLTRMATTPTPLLERMTLFWHTHFATAFTGQPDVGNMIRQNQTIRANALGDLRQLLYQLTVDGAMLYWLSGNQNRRNAVNENYGRELLELFTMGTRPQAYTETDIRQAARALTGWTVKADRTTAFDKNRHTTGTKTVLGSTVGGYPSGDAREATEYKEVVDAALRQPTTSLFVAYKMVSAFAYVPASQDFVNDPDPLVDAVAASLRPATPTGVWDIAAAMRTLLNHTAFRDPDHATGKVLVRSPIEMGVHLSKPLGVRLDPPGGLNQTNNYNYNIPTTALRRMGQVPFQPPNVGGWPKGTQWLSDITTRARYDFGQFMISAWSYQGNGNLSPLPASGDIAGWTSFLGLGSLTPLTLDRITTYLATPGAGNEATKQNSVLLLLVSSPDWQVM